MRPEHLAAPRFWLLWLSCRSAGRARRPLTRRWWLDGLLRSSADGVHGGGAVSRRSLSRGSPWRCGTGGGRSSPGGASSPSTPTVVAARWSRGSETPPAGSRAAATSLGQRLTRQCGPGRRCRAVAAATPTARGARADRPGSTAGCGRRRRAATLELPTERRLEAARAASPGPTASTVAPARSVRRPGTGEPGGGDLLRRPRRCAIVDVCRPCRAGSVAREADGDSAPRALGGVAARRRRRCCWRADGVHGDARPRRRCRRGALNSATQLITMAGEGRYDRVLLVIGGSFRRVVDPMDHSFGRRRLGVCRYGPRLG